MKMMKMKIKHNVENELKKNNFDKMTDCYTDSFYASLLKVSISKDDIFNN
jgi:hypothetical protein